MSLCRSLDLFPQAPQWAGLKSIIKVTSYRHVLKGQFLHIKEPAVRYYISSLEESVESFARRIREYWHVENKVHYVRDVTQVEDASRIRVQQQFQIPTYRRKFCLNAERVCWVSAIQVCKSNLTTIQGEREIKGFGCT